MSGLTLFIVDIGHFWMIILLGPFSVRLNGGCSFFGDVSACFMVYARGKSIMESEREMLSSHRLLLTTKGNSVRVLSPWMLPMNSLES